MLVNGRGSGAIGGPAYRWGGSGARGQWWGGVPDFTLRHAQLAARQNELGLRLAARLILAKVVGSIDTVRSLPQSLPRDRAQSKLAGALHELHACPPADLESLRLVEGRAALADFTC
jgi:CRISPR/Cas system-associated endonuclease Cas1